MGGESEPLWVRPSARNVNKQFSISSVSFRKSRFQCDCLEAPARLDVPRGAMSFRLGGRHRRYWLRPALPGLQGGGSSGRNQRKR